MNKGRGMADAEGPHAVRVSGSAFHRTVVARWGNCHGVGAFLATCLALTYPGALPSARAVSFEKTQAEVVPFEATGDMAVAPKSSRIYIPSSEDWHAAGQWLREELAKKGCRKVEVLEAASAVETHGLVLSPAFLTSPNQGNGCAILMGHMGNNALIRWLYIHWRITLDADYLADGGWAVQGVRRSWGAAGDALIIHAMDVASARKGVGRLLEMLLPAPAPASFADRLAALLAFGGRRLVVPSVFEFHPAPSKRPAVAQVTTRIDQVEKQFAAMFDRKSASFQGIEGQREINNWLTGAMKMMGNLGVWWSVTADPRCPVLASRIMKEVHSSLGDFQGDMSHASFDYSFEPMARGINLLLDHPSLSASDRRLVLGMMSLLATAARPYQAQLDQGCNPKRNRPVIGSRHTVAMYAGLYHLGRFLEQRAELKGATRRAVSEMLTSSRRYLDTMTRSYCDAFEHLWTLDTIGILQQYALEKPNPGFVSTGQFQLGADFDAMLMRPDCNSLVLWGGENVGPGEMFRGWTFLGRAETVLSGGEYQWFHDRHLGSGPPQKTWLYGEPHSIHVYNPGHPPVEPTRLTGVCLAPTNPLIDEDIFDGVRSLWNMLSPRGAPAGQSFHKLSYRSSWSPDAQYFLINGVGGYDYGASGMAGFLSYDQFGVQLLCSVQPRLGERYQNTVFVNRGRLNGRGMPFEAAAESLVECESGGYARLRLDNCNGANWTRHVFWEKNSHILVWDELEAAVEDDFFLTCGWRSPLLGANYDAAARTMTAGQSNVVFRIVNAEMAGQPPGHMVCRNEEACVMPFYSDLRVTTLQQNACVHLAKGEKYHFVNLLHATRDAAATPPTIKSTGLLSVRVNLVDGERCYALRDARGQVQLGNLRATATALAAQPKGWQAHDLTELVPLPDNVPSLVKTDAPVHLEVQSSNLTFRSSAWKRDSVRVSPQDQRVVAGATGPDRIRLGKSEIQITPKAIPAVLAFPKPVPSPSAPAETEAKRPMVKGLRISSTLGSFPNQTDGASSLDSLAVGSFRGHPLIAVGLREKRLKVLDENGRELWQLPTPHRISALYWTTPDRPQDEPFLMMGLYSNGTGKNVRAFDLRGHLQWENDLGEPLAYAVFQNPYSFAQFDADGDGRDELVVGTYCGDVLFNGKGDRLATKRTDIFHSLKHLVLPALPPAPSWMWTATLQSPANIYTLAGEPRKIWAYTCECTWPYQLLRLGEPVNGVYRVALAHGPYLAVGAFNTRTGDWVTDSCWRCHLGADVRALCLAPSANQGNDPEILCAGDFGFLDRYTAKGVRTSRVSFEGTVHRLIRLPDGNLLAGTEDRGLVVLHSDGHVLGSIEGDSGAAVVDILNLPEPSASAGRYLVVCRSSRLEIMEASP